jgi:tetratricopeptide (TPR) repeat protein
VGLWWGWGWWGWGGWGYPYYGYPYWGYPYYGYAPYYYSPPPTYYSTVVYDNSGPAAEQVAAQATASGEGSVYTQQAPGTRASESGLAVPRGLAPLPNEASDALTRGDEAFRSARYIDAVHEYARAVELAPDRGVLHLVLSDGLLATGDYHYAAYALRRALELDPTLVDSVLDKHSFYGNTADCDQHIAALEKYVGEHPLDDDARLLLAANYLFSNRTLRAKEVLDDPASAAVRETATGKVLAERIRKTVSETAPEAQPK